MPIISSEPRGENNNHGQSNEDKDHYSSAPNIWIQGIKISSRFAHVYPVFESNTLKQVVSKLGYTWVIREPPRGETMGLEAVLNGTVARKEDLSIEYQTDRQVIAVSGNYPNRVTGSFQQLIYALQKTIEPVRLKIYFFEALMTSLAEGNKSPLEVFSSGNNQFKKEELDKVFEESISTHSLKLCPPNRPVDSTDWFEYNIEPLYFRDWRTYTASMVYRNTELDSVINAISKFEDRMKKTILALEK
jgi:hypothetical protein